MLLLTRHPTTTYYSFDRGDEIDNISCNFTTDNLTTLLLKQKDLTYVYNVLYKSFCNNNLPTILKSAGLARLEVEIESLFEM